MFSIDLYFIFHSHYFYLLFSFIFFSLFQLHKYICPFYTMILSLKITNSTVIFVLDLQKRQCIFLKEEKNGLS